MQSWDKIVLEAEIGESMTARTFWLMNVDVRFQANGEIPREFRPILREAQLFLRDDLLKVTGDRIWGFVFTLHKEGRFEIEYNYDMPEEYRN